MCVSAGLQTTLWCRSDTLAADITRDRQNAKYLPGHRLPDALRITSDLADIADHDLLVLATPAQATREVAGQLNKHANQTVPLIVTAKGLERGIWKRPEASERQMCQRGHLAAVSGTRREHREDPGAAVGIR